MPFLLFVGRSCYIVNDRMVKFVIQTSLAIFRRWEAMGLPEIIREMALVVVAHAGHDFFDRERPILKQPFGGLQFHLFDVLTDGDAESVFEQMAQPRGREIGVRGDLFQRWIALQVTLNVFENWRHPADGSLVFMR
jgi:hypothetical protein